MNIIVADKSMVVLSDSTIRRANVIAYRTNSEVM